MIHQFIIFILRCIPDWIKGKTRISKFLLNNFCLRTSDLIIPLKSGHKLLVPNVKEPIAFSILISGVYEQDVFNVIKDNLSQGDIFVDVGANVGCFSIPLSTTVGLSGQIHSFEASPTISRYLKNNIQLNGLSNIFFNNIAVSDKDGLVSFYDAPIHKFGMGGLASVGFGSTLVEVPSICLNHYFQVPCKIKVLKIDVEGFEVCVLKGASKLLQNNYVDLIIFEFLDWAEARVPNHRPGDSQRYLMDHGFQIWRLCDYLKGRKPLENALETGGDMLVAKKVSHE